MAPIRLRFTHLRAPLASSIATVRGVCSQNPILQLLRKFALWCKSSRHCVSHCKVANILKSIWKLQDSYAGSSYQWGTGGHDSERLVYASLSLLAMAIRSIAIADLLKFTVRSSRSFIVIGFQTSEQDSDMLLPASILYCKRGLYVYRCMCV
jgi:hypothetical protein